MLLLLTLTGAGCAEGAKLIRETPQGGVVSYPYKSDRNSMMFSGSRKEALDLMAKKCPSGYAILQEGETRGNTSASGLADNTEGESRYRRWGLQFRCKGG